MINPPITQKIMDINKLFILFCIAVACISCKEDIITQEKITGSVTDCQGRVYATVQIGDQWWMAENLSCTQYDTESERQPAAPATFVPVPLQARTGTAVAYGPFYVDDSADTTQYSGNLTAIQRSKLGLLYSWAAVVGLTNTTSQTTDFVGNRQGICPNGWHVPTDAEWSVLINNLGGENNAGSVMKTPTGWYTGDNYAEGNNSSGFSVLPAGYDLGVLNPDGKTPATFGTGFDASFWSASANAWYRGFSCNSSVVQRMPMAKYKYFSVRCVKNAQE